MALIHTLQEALNYSNDAVNVTRSELSNGNDNQYANVEGSILRLNPRDATYFVDMVRGQDNVGTTPLEFYLCRAKIAMAGHAGNCGENAAVAFAYLYVNGVHPIAIGSYDVADHAFVLVGNDGNNWLSICDPWANLYGPVRERHHWQDTIWRDVPPDNDMRIEITVTTPGSMILYTQATQYQGAIDAMEM
ncbi:MAG: hypothetical protein ACI9CO_000025 [Candidatus Azotimanducaceae bacterium]|jgi:hypothetical protein